MLKSISGTLRRLGALLSGKAEDAYDERDDAKSDSHEESFAAGKAQAYGISADEVRKEQEDGDPDER